ncbi:MAG TPA: FAD-binding protein [Clostridium sp.]
MYIWLFLFAQETQDVANAVRWARFWDVPIRMRSGRHNYEGLSVVDAGIVIDVSEMKRVEVNRKLGTATVQTGLRDRDTRVPRIGSASWSLSYHRHRRVYPGGRSE